MSQFLAELYTACVVEHARDNVDGVLKGPFYVIGKEARDAFNLPYDEAIFKKVLEILENLNALKIYRNPGIQSYYRLDVKKFDAAMKMSMQVRSYKLISPFDEDSPNYPFLESYADLGSDFLIDALGAHDVEIKRIVNNVFAFDESADPEFSSNLSEDTIDIPASDRVVNLHHNQQAEIEEPLNDVLKLVECENSIDGEDGLRELILGRIKAGRELIRAGIFSIRSLQLTLMVGLQMLIEKYRETAIGVLSAKLLDLLIAQIGFD